MSTIEKLQNDISKWYEESSIRQFMHWWKTELKTFVPEKYQQQLFPQPLLVYLVQGKEGVKVWQQIDGTQEICNKEKQEGEKWWHTVQHVINQADGKKVIVKFLLPKNEVLVRKIALPQAAKENLDDVIGFELDRFVPFKPEQVQMSYKVDRENQNQEKIQLTLAVIPKEKLEEITQLCDEKSVALDGLDANVSGDGKAPILLGVNLLLNEQRKKHDSFNLKLNLGLMALLVGLVYFVMYTSLDNKQSKVDRLTEINSSLQKEARTSKKLRKELKNVIVSSKFLQTKKQDTPALVSILSEVTSILPDHTYITRLKIDQDRIEITGQSDDANGLVPGLDKSSLWFNPRIVGGVTPDRVTKKEKFTIRAEFKEPKEEDEDGSNS